MAMRSSPGQEPSVDEAICPVQLEDEVQGVVMVLKLVTPGIVQDYESATVLTLSLFIPEIRVLLNLYKLNLTQ